MKKYSLIFYIGTDESAEFRYASAAEIRNIIKMYKLTEYDYAIVDGELLKWFDNRSFDIKNLK